MKKYILIFSLFVVNQLFAQEKQNHESHKNEIGVAIAPVYFGVEKEWSSAIHLHYIYSIPKTKFGVGLGYERIFDEHKHTTIGVVGMYRPLEKLSFNFSPGLSYEKENVDPIFAFHIESTYEFEYKDFHFGPVLEYAYDKEDYHLSLGIHLGVGF